MSSPKISIRIDTDGNVHFDVIGAPGQSCTSLTELLTRDLGDIEEQQFTEEYNQELPDYIKSFETEE